MSWAVRQRSAEIRLNKIGAARRICSGRRRQARRTKPRYEQFPHFWPVNNDDRDKGSSQDVEDIRENPIFEFAVDPEGNYFGQPRHAHQ